MCNYVFVIFYTFLKFFPTNKMLVEMNLVSVTPIKFYLQPMSLFFSAGKIAARPKGEREREWEKEIE